MYAAPKCKVGSRLRCLHRGQAVKVIGFTDTPIRWPMAEVATVNQRTCLVPILCGDLVRAIMEEPQAFVAKQFGISTYLYTRFKEAIAGCTGRNQVWAALAILRHDPKFRKKYRYPA